MAMFTGNIYSDILVLVVSFSAFIVLYLKWCFTYWKRKGVYTLPPSVPFGNAKSLVLQKEFVGTELTRIYNAFIEKGLMYGGYYVFGKPVFVPVDLDCIKRMLTKDFDHFTNRIHYVDSEREPLTGNLVLLKDSKWRNLRSKLTPTFTSGKMKMMFQTMVDCTKELITIVDDSVKMNETLDIREVISRFTTDAVGLSAFGIECNSLRNPDAEFLKYGKSFFNTTSLWDSIVRTMSFLTPEILHYCNFRTVRKDITEFFTRVFEETVNYRERHQIVRNDFLHLLIQLKNNVNIKEKETKNTEGVTPTSNSHHAMTSKQETALTMEELTAQCFIFFLEGFETSSTTTTFYLYEMANNLEIQSMLRSEIHIVLAKYGGKITYDALMEMTYLDKCISETLRKHPPFVMLTRECTRTYRIPDSDVVIEKGTFVFVPIVGIHHNSELYPDPEKFDPERFSEEQKTLRHPSAWLPFGDGPRNCIGLRFALMQIKVGLVVLLKNFKFILNSRTKSPLVIDPKMPFIPTPEGGIWLDAEKVQ